VRKYLPASITVSRKLFVVSPYESLAKELMTTLCSALLIAEFLRKSRKVSSDSIIL